MNLNFTSNNSYNKQYSSGIYNYTKKEIQSQVGLPNLIRQNSISNLKKLKNNVNTIYNNNTKNNKQNNK